MSKHILKLHVESPGALYVAPGGEPSRSIGGHAWFEVVFPDGLSLQVGFALKDQKSGTSSVQGKVFKDDGPNYQGSPLFTASYEVTADQARTLKQFSDDPGKFGFDIDKYHAVNNSCVDFVWKALETIGMNPLKKQGDVLPIDNMDDFMRLTNPAIRTRFPTPISLLKDAWDFLRQPDPLPALPWEIAFEEEEPQGIITIGPLGAPAPVVPLEMDFATPTPQGSITVGPLGQPEPIKAPEWPGFTYGDCLVMDDPTPGTDRGDHSLCRRFYSQISVQSFNQPLLRMGDGAMTASGRNDFSSPWIA